jgi:hypothetical protein
VTAEIESLKLKLQESQQRKQHRLEYDAKAKSIVKLQSRLKNIRYPLYTIRYLIESNQASVEKEVQRLDTEYEILIASKEQRKKYVASTVSLIHETQDMIAEIRQREEKDMQSGFQDDTPDDAMEEEEEEEGAVQD